MNRFSTMHDNMEMVREILSSNDQKIIHSQLDKLINSVKITYSSKKDFIDNFPDEDDIAGKIRLIVTRRN